jgi:hypothetical protein
MLRLAPISVYEKGNGLSRATIASRDRPVLPSVGRRGSVSSQRITDTNKSHSMSRRPGKDSSRDDDQNNKSMGPTVSIETETTQRNKGVASKVVKTRVFSNSLFIPNLYNRDNVNSLGKFYPTQQKFAW